MRDLYIHFAMTMNELGLGKPVGWKKASKGDMLVDLLLEVNSCFLHFVIFPCLHTTLFHIIFPTLVFY